MIVDGVVEDTQADAPRSYLYVPGDREEFLRGALSRGADAVVVDLEDSVPPARKEFARQTVRSWLAEQQPGIDQIWMRINADAAETDLVGVVGQNLSGIVVPKATPGLVQRVDELLDRVERQLGLPAGHFRVLALVETAEGLLDCRRLAAADRVDRLGFGEADLSGELGFRRSGEHAADLTPLRLQVVLASAAAGIAGPVGPTSTTIRDLSSLRESTLALLGLGFRARTAVHPAQVETINEVFTPSDEEVSRARSLIARYQAAVLQGAGVVVDEHGAMVDRAVIRAAQDVLRRTRSSAASG